MILHYDFERLCVFNDFKRLYVSIATLNVSVFEWIIRCTRELKLRATLFTGQMKQVQPKTTVDGAGRINSSITPITMFSGA